MSAGLAAPVVERGVAMTTRDGVELVADVHRPAEPGRHPVLLMRTPYGRGAVGGEFSEADFFPRYGYVVVVQDVRGRGGSAGGFWPYRHEGRDGYDAVEWAARLPWSDGRVALAGQSYLGGSAYSAAVEAPPSLVAAAPVAGPARLFGGTLIRQGAFDLRYRLSYFIAMERGTRAGDQDRRRQLASYLVDRRDPLSMLTDEAYRHLPLSDWADRLAIDVRYVHELFEHWDDGSDPFWQEADAVRRAAEVRVPMLHIGSWYDAFQVDTLAMYGAVAATAQDPVARSGQRLVMGPWAHLRPFTKPTSRATGDIDFGPAAAVELLEEQRRFFDRVFGRRQQADDEPNVRLFTMGVNRWRDEASWPLARARQAALFLAAGGVLSPDPPSLDEAPDTYLHEPDDPVPTVGGNLIGPGAGVQDQSGIARRRDVLAYTGPVLDADLEVTGAVSVELVVASSAPDTDFVAKLVDLHPGGFAQNVLDGIARARFRDGPAPAPPLRPGEPVSLTVDLWSTSHVFLAGHRVQLLVMSSNFPRYDRNAGSGGPLAADCELVAARQTVFHDAARASRLLLPVIPG